MEQLGFPKIIKLGEYEFKFLTELEVERDNNGEVITRSTRDIIGRYEDINNYYKGVFCNINNYNPKEIMMKNNIYQDFAGYYFLVLDNKKFLHSISKSTDSVITNIENIKNKSISAIKLKGGTPTYSRLNILTCLMKQKGHNIAVYVCENNNPNDIEKKKLQNILSSIGYSQVTYDLNEGKLIGYENENREIIHTNQTEEYNVTSDYPPHFQWIDFYTKLTNKILDYKNNKSEFKNKVINLISSYSKIGNYEQSGIDPLSFIYELARLWRRKEKFIIYSKICKEFEIETNINNIEEWIFINPVYNTFFYYGNELENNDIHWEFFSMAKNDEFIEENIFNKILTIKNISIVKLTQVLSLINPENYIAYDAKTMSYSSVLYNKANELGYSLYREHQNKLYELFPDCKAYEINAFIKLNDIAKSNGIKRKVYQISSYMRDDKTKKSDHLDNFINTSTVYVDSETTASGIPYIIKEPNKFDIIVARYGNSINAIGMIIKNDYKHGYKLEGKIHVVWINKHREENVLVKPIDIALKEMTGIDLEKSIKLYRETFKMIDITASINLHLIELIKFKKQIILQGAPGTGKTYTAKKIAEEMGIDYDIIQFHPSYTYEDFVRGISAKSENGNIIYEIEDKILMNVVNKAKDKPYILIIDEINRTNLPSVLGELLYALEYRGEAVKCPYGESITIPENLYIIGTMNTADRSIGSIDYAIRRRFAFYTVLSNSNIIEDEEAKNLYKQVYELIDKHVSEEYNIDDIMVGHSYFLPKEDDCPDNYLELSLEYNIIPLLMEYYKDGILIDKDNIDKNDNNSVLNKIKNLKNYFNSEK